MFDTFTRFGGVGGVGGVLVLLELLLFSLDRLGWWNGVQTWNISHAAGGPRGPWTWETLNSQPILYPQNICWTKANSGYQTSFADFTVYSPGSEEQCPNHSHRGACHASHVWTDSRCKKVIETSNPCTDSATWTCNLINPYPCLCVAHME